MHSHNQRDLAVPRMFDIPENVEQARKLLKSGLGDEATAKRMGCSRSTVAKLRARAGIAPTFHKNNPTTKPGVPSMPTARLTLPKLADITGPAWEPLPGVPPISMMELPDGRGVRCRWPVTGGYCGLPSGERTYCDHHHEMARGKGTDSERSALRVLRKMAA